MQLSLGLAFLAGLVSFVTPCVLALVPVYLAYLGETAAAEGVAGERGVRSGAARLLGQPVVFHAAVFTLSFSAIFVLMGTSVGLLGGQLFRLPVVREVASVVVIALGILTTGVFGPVLDRFRMGLDSGLVAAAPQARAIRSALLGAVFALGWSPCIGPVLGAILTLGASSQDVGAAALLLAFYSAGLAVPFLAAAVALPQLTPLIHALRRWHRPVEIVAGLFIVLMGVLIYLNAFGQMAALFNVPL